MRLLPAHITLGLLMIAGAITHTVGPFSSSMSMSGLIEEAEAAERHERSELNVQRGAPSDASQRRGLPTVRAFEARVRFLFASSVYLFLAILLAVVPALVVLHRCRIARRSGQRRAVLVSVGLLVASLVVVVLPALVFVFTDSAILAFSPPAGEQSFTSQILEKAFRDHEGTRTRVAGVTTVANVLTVICVVAALWAVLVLLHTTGDMRLRTLGVRPGPPKFEGRVLDTLVPRLRENQRLLTGLVLLASVALSAGVAEVFALYTWAAERASLSGPALRDDLLRIARVMSTAAGAAFTVLIGSILLVGFAVNRSVIAQVSAHLGSTDRALGLQTAMWERLSGVAASLLPLLVGAGVGEAIGGLFR